MRELKEMETITLSKYKYEVKHLIKQKKKKKNN